MKRLLSSLALVCLVAVPAVADKVTDKDMAEFKALVEKCATSWATLNPDNVAALYAKDADLVFFDLAPLKYTGWSEYDTGVREQFKPFESLALTTQNDLRVRREGKMAVTTGTIHAVVKMKSQAAPMEFDARQTLVWERRNGKWLIVHEHISAPLPPHTEG